jgi:pimeloyl-ACP methyl ester carboxylesterase
MSTLPVPGARLYYETHGRGPLMVMIAGATGTADGFRALASVLGARYTVLLYDRRGFSRSTLEGSQDRGRRLETDADDARRLIEHAGGEAAAVFGASSGAIVALSMLARHPCAARALVPFEPPAMRLLPDGRKWLGFFAELHGMYRAGGAEQALERFRERTFAEPDRQAMARAPRSSANIGYWFEHELRQYPAAELDLDALAAHAQQILPAAGRASRGYPACEATVELGRRLGRTVLELPGGHIGHLTRTADFAAALAEALSAHAETRL